MNTDVMRTYCDLVEMGSFSKAAEENYVSQSAVSQQLAKLERDMAVQLISRGGGLVVPTEAGREFYRGAKEILRRYEQLLGQVRSAADAIRGVLRIGTIYSAGFYVLDAYIGKFLQAHPEVNLHIEYTRSNRIYAEVISGQMDMGVVAYPEKHRSIEIIPLASEEMVMTCSPKHRLAERSRIDLKDIDGEKFIGFEPNIPTRRHIDRHLKREKINVDVMMEFDNIETVKRAVQIGAGISILPKDSMEREVQYGDMACVRFKEPKKWVRTIAVLRHRGKAPSPAERMFLMLLRKKG